MGRELDVKIAVAMGCDAGCGRTYSGDMQDDYPTCLCPDKAHADPLSYAERQLYRYSSDWSAAKLVVDAAVRDGMDVQLEIYADETLCILILGDPNAAVAGSVWRTAPTLPEAVCLAFLAAKEASHDRE